MFDAKGRPLKDVCIDLEPMGGRGENGAYFFKCSEAGGVFQMSMMPPGEYWLVARDEVGVGRFKSKSTLYCPGVRDRQQATMVSIKAIDRPHRGVPADSGIVSRFQSRTAQQGGDQHPIQADNVNLDC